MSPPSPVCICGKLRGEMNSTNWSRHMESCQKKRKQNSNSSSILKFFKASSSKPAIHSSKTTSTLPGKH